MTIDELLRERGEQWQAPDVAEPDLDAALGRAARRRNTGIAAAAAVAVLATGGVVWTNLSGQPITAVPAASATPTGPTTTLRDVTRLVRTQVRAIQTTSLVEAEQTLTTIGTVQEQLLRETPPEQGAWRQVALVQLIGDFTCPDCTRLEGATADGSGTVFTLVFDAYTGEKLLATISTRVVDLEGMGNDGVGGWADLSELR